MALARAVGQAILKSLIPFNMPGWQMIAIVKKAGYSYRNTLMLSDIREYTGRLKYEEQVRGLLSNQAIPGGWMNRVEMKGPYKYKVWADVKYYDPVSGDFVTDARAMYTDDLKKIQEQKNDFEDRLHESGCRCDMEFWSAEIRGMDINTKMI